MVAPVLREPAFIWACVLLLNVCVLAALVVRHQEFLLGFLERFIRLPPSGKAVLATAVVVATVFAQKPTNESTNQSESAEIEANLSEVSATLNTENEEDRRHGEGEDGLDRIDKISEADTSNPSNPENPVKETPCLPSSNYSVFSVADTPLLSSNDVVRGYRL